MPTKTAKSNLDDQLARYGDALSGSAHTRQNSLAYARAFLEHSNGAMTRATVLAFLDAMGLKGKANPLPRRRPVSAGTKELCYRIMRRLFLTNGEEWPFRKGEGPALRTRDQLRVALHPLAVKRAILAAQEGALSPQDRAFLALSTTYGMRLSEIGGVAPEHLDLLRAQLYVETLKHGRDRTHLIPDQILPVMKAYDFQARPTSAEMHQSWVRIEEAGDVPRVKGVGYHAVRRSLDTLLGEKLPLPIIRRFMRWKAGEEDMAIRYNTVQMVGAGQSYFTVDEGEIKEDSRVFEVHPFLPLWEGQDSWATLPGKD